MPDLENTTKIVKEKNLDLSNHVSKAVNDKLVEKADIILVMEYKPQANEEKI